MINLYYALKYPDGRLVGLDEASGGYPYATESIGSAWLKEANETNLKDFQNFQEMFPATKFTLILLKISELNIIAQMPIKVSR